MAKPQLQLPVLALHPYLREFTAKAGWAAVKQDAGYLHEVVRHGLEGGALSLLLCCHTWSNGNWHKVRWQKDKHMARL
jgi:hypothetical protein